MTAGGRADVAVVSGGPAGAVTALLLARAGRDVVLYEQSRYDALHMGGTLSVSPATDVLLRRLGLWDPSTAHGRHVDSGRFGVMLIEAAQQAGVRVLRGGRVSSVVRVDGGLGVEADKPTLVTTVVDATGRAARIARGLGAKRVQFDRLVCVTRVFDIGSEPPGDTFIEAASDGW